MAFAYYRQLSFDRTKCGASNLTSFPVLVSISNAAFGSRVTSASGSDIVFAIDKAGVNKVPWEIEYFDKPSGTMLAWVNAATLNGSAAGANSSLYMCFGDPTITTPQNIGPNAPAQVWANGYVGVWHLPNGSSLTASDSTATGAHGTINGVTATAGKIDGGGSFGGSSFINVGTVINFEYNSPFTISCWVRCDATAMQVLLSKMMDGPTYQGLSYEFGKSTYNWLVRLYLINSYSATNYFSVDGVAQNVSAGELHYMTMAYDGASRAAGVSHYVDAALLSNIANQDSLSASALNAIPLVLGDRYFAGSLGLTGMGDEFRISNVARTADWVLSEYNNQNAPGNIGADNFVIFGAETAAVQRQAMVTII